MTWRRFLRRDERDAECAREIRFHMDAEIAENIARGMPPEEARQAAYRKLGNGTLVREEVYLANSLGFMEILGKNVGYALRTLRRSPLFAGTAVLTLALGIGGNTAMFSVVRAVLLQPLAYHEPDRLVSINVENSQLSIPTLPFSRGELDEMRSDAHSFEGIGAYFRTPESMSLSGGENGPEPLKGARVSANFLDVLGVRPLAGRTFLPEEDRSGGPPVVMISAALWHRRFGADSEIAGKTVTLDDRSYTIVGVLPAGFEFPASGYDIWLPRPSEWSALPSRYWGIPLLNGFGRLNPGATLEQARAELAVLHKQYLRANPSSITQKNASMTVSWLKDHIVADVRTMLWTLVGAVGFVLLIGCANIASLMLGRAASRSREFAVRAAIGASRGRLIGQLLTESLILAAAGGALGILLAHWIARAIPHIKAYPLPHSGQIQLDGAVLAFSVALTIATGVLFGLFPAVQTSRPDLAAVLRESGAAAGRRAYTLRNPRSLLIVAQVALSVVLMIGAVLLIESFARLRGIEPGFQPTNLLTLRIALPGSRYDTDQKRKAFFDEVVAKVADLPGVRATGVALSLPTTLNNLSTNVVVEGQPAPDPSDQQIAQLQAVSPGYFRAMGIPLRRGRELSQADNRPSAPPVVVINESFARKFWPDYPRGLDPIGQRMGEGADHVKGAEIVGIAGDVHEHSLRIEAEPEFYVPVAIHTPQTAFLTVRTSGDPLRVVSAIRNQVQSIDPDQAVADVRTMTDLLDQSLGERRLTLALLATFAGIAMLLAAIGIYGMVAYSVAQRTQEIGIRRALGAQEGNVLRLVLQQGAALAISGVGLGLIGAGLLTRLMKALLFQVSPMDAPAFMGIALLFVAIALLASYLPARKATQVDPMTALRVG
ncbi:MAG TPA: ABC transporter permease [Bryobacteraceae bacterium]